MQVRFLSPRQRGPLSVWLSLLTITSKRNSFCLPYGVVAQQGERSHGMREVAGSIPVDSTHMGRAGRGPVSKTSLAGFESLVSCRRYRSWWASRLEPGGDGRELSAVRFRYLLLMLGQRGVNATELAVDYPISGCCNTVGRNVEAAGCLESERDGVAARLEGDAHLAVCGPSPPLSSDDLEGEPVREPAPFRKRMAPQGVVFESPALLLLYKKEEPPRCARIRGTWKRRGCRFSAAGC